MNPEAKPRFRITTSCAGCQAFGDADDLVWYIERVGNEFELPPERLAHALAVLAAQWAAAAARYTAAEADTEFTAELAGEVNRRVMGEVANALHHFLDLAPATSSEHCH